MATARIPRGAVASVLAKEGKKKTTLRDMPRVSTGMKILSRKQVGCHSNVSQLSFVLCDGCYERFRDTLQKMRRYILDDDSIPIIVPLVIAGRRCTVHTNSTQVISSLRKWCVPRDLANANDFELRVLVDRGLRSQPVLPQFRGHGEYVFAIFQGIDSFTFDLRHRRISAVVSDETAQDVAFWTTVLIPIALGVLGPMMDLCPMHSACLARNGRGMLLAGVSGAGKSTLATALAQEGMSLVSDDWIYAAEIARDISVYGLRVPVKLMPDAADYFDALRAEEPRVALNGELAFEVDARTLGIEVSDHCEAECIVFLERGEGPTRIVPLERAIARQFFHGSAEPLPPEFCQAAKDRARLIHAVTDRDCWHFRYAGTPHEGARILREFFEDVYHVERTSTSVF